MNCGRAGLGAALLFVLAAPLGAWDTRPDFNFRNLNDRAGDDHRRMMVQSILNLGRSASGQEAARWRVHLEYGAWYADYIGARMAGDSTARAGLPRWVGILFLAMHHFEGGQIGRLPIAGARAMGDSLYRLAVVTHRRGDPSTAWILVGWACHFVQDVTHPFHGYGVFIPLHLTDFADARMRAFGRVFRLTGILCGHYRSDLGCHARVEHEIRNRQVWIPFLRAPLFRVDRAGEDAVILARAAYGTDLAGIEAWHRLTETGQWNRCAMLASRYFGIGAASGAGLLDAFYRATR